MLLIVSPLLVAWFMGLYDDWSRQRTQRELQSISAMLFEQAPRVPGGDDSWVDRFGEDHRVFIRVLDRRGVQVHRTDPLYGDGRFSQVPWFERVADFFFGPQGAPDLLDYERVLPQVTERSEVRDALAGAPGETWRKPDAGKMIVFYRAIPRPGGDGAFYLSRMSRRSVIALYDLRYQLLKLTLVLVVVALIVSLWVTRHIVSPLVRIQDACRAYLKNGASAPIALTRRDEIGDLSRDLDELTRRLQDQATHTRQVTADLAHDLKSPLSTIHASADLLRDSAILDARLERAAGRAITWLALPHTATYYDHKNRGFDATRGDIVAFLDADCDPAPGWLDAITAPIAAGRARVVAGTTTYRGALAPLASRLDFPYFTFDRTRGTVLNFFANNVAFARDVFAAHRYPTIEPMYHGQCQVLALQLHAAGIAIQRAADARATHAWPDGLLDWLTVRLLRGADTVSLLPHVVAHFAPRAMPTVSRLGRAPALAVLGLRAATGSWLAVRDGPIVRGLALVAAVTLVDALGAAGGRAVYRALA